MWVTKFLISPVKNKIFCRRTTKFGSKLAFCSFLARARARGKDIHYTFFGNVVRGKSELFRLVVRTGSAHFIRKVFARRKLLPGKFWVFAPLAGGVTSFAVGVNMFCLSWIS